MTRQIDADTLREWLETHHPVTVLDIRTDEDRAAWAIPTSIHINAYDALKRGEAGALADARLPADRPIVTVCNAGQASRTAADILANGGLNVMSQIGRAHI